MSAQVSDGVTVPHGGEPAGGGVHQAGASLDAVDALAAGCTPAEELGAETYERLLTVLDRLS